MTDRYGDSTEHLGRDLARGVVLGTLLEDYCFGYSFFDPTYPHHRTPRRCPFCGEVYRVHAGFADHRDRCEQGPNPGANPVCDGGAIECVLCDETSDTPEGHEQHMAEVHDYRAVDLYCERCGSQVEHAAASYRWLCPDCGTLPVDEVVPEDEIPTCPLCDTRPGTWPVALANTQECCPNGDCPIVTWRTDRVDEPAGGCQEKGWGDA